MSIDPAAIAAYNAGVQRAAADYRRRMSRFGAIERGAHAEQTRRLMAALAAAEGLDIAQLRAGHAARERGERLTGDLLDAARAYNRLRHIARTQQRRAESSAA